MRRSDEEQIVEFMGKKPVPLESIADNSIVNRLERDGFIDKLYGRHSSKWNPAAALLRNASESVELAARCHAAVDRLFRRIQEKSDGNDCED